MGTAGFSFVVIPAIQTFVGIFAHQAAPALMGPARFGAADAADKIRANRPDNAAFLPHTALLFCTP